MAAKESRIYFQLFIGILFLLSGFQSIAKASKQEQKVDSVAGITMNRTVNISIQQLEDNAGLKYLGGIVQEADISCFLEQMKKITGEKFTQFRQAQIERDHHQFHITLVNPYEYNALNSEAVDVIKRKKLSFQLVGLGQVTKDSHQTYFIIAHSKTAQQARTDAALTPKDFHITLGFFPQDIYGVSKGIDTLVTLK